jgi:hypothetical protein
MDGPYMEVIIAMTAKATTSVPNRPGVWYKIYIDECVMCGAYEETRVRMRGPKPKDRRARYSYREYGCVGHFI